MDTKKNGKPNQCIRNYAKKNGVYLWEVAAEIGIAEATMTRMMRFEVEEDLRDRLLHIIDDIAAKKHSN